MDLKIFTNNIEQDALDQVHTLLSQDAFKECKVRIMPDVHAGKGCVIGFTADLGDKVIPNIVGVDIGCVDLYTEYLTPTGWKKIKDYDGEPIAVFDTQTKQTRFENPINYIKTPCNEFLHFKTKYGIDQMLSPEHKCLLEKGKHHRPGVQGELHTLSAQEIYDRHSSLKLGFRDNFICEIPNILIDGCNDMTDAQIRVQVMVAADGHIRENGSCVCKFKKKRKAVRCEELLKSANIEYRICDRTEKGLYGYSFTPPSSEKRLSQFWNCSVEQLSIICDEVMLWDGNQGYMQYYSNYEEDVDFVQYAFAATGHRTNIDYDSRCWNWNFRCNISKSAPRVQLAGTPKTEIKKKMSIDGFKYCFTASTGFWIMRRNGCICVTGNCGMLTVQIEEKDINFERLDNVIRQYVPYGRNVHEGRSQRFDLSALKCFRELRDTKRLERSLGTLGGGNHFIEIDADVGGNKYLVIHTGSRNLGKQVADYYQNLAHELMSGKDDLYAKQEALIEEYKAAGRKAEIQGAIKELRRNFKAHNPNIPKDLCYLEGKYREDYLHDMGICQQFAELNRNAISDTIMSHMGWHCIDSFQTIHNYIDLESNIVRKGAISAKEGQILLIPINMRDGCILGVGKGNEDWNQSAPHGAGRLMSRMKAKEQLTMEDYQSSMSGIYTTSVSADTLDEAPMAYKPIHEIIENIGPAVRILKILKPVYNFKASE